MRPERPLLAARMRSLEYKQVLDLGRASAPVLAHWTDARSDRVVIIGERYQHILHRHPEIAGLEESIIQTALDPEHVHINRNDVRMAILYRPHEGRTWLRISLWISNDTRFQNSIHSARYAREREVRLGIEQGREIWGKG